MLPASSCASCSMYSMKRATYGPVGQRVMKIGEERQQWDTVHLGFWVMAKPVNTNQGSIVIDSKVGHGTQSMVVWGDKGVEELL